MFRAFRSELTKLRRWTVLAGGAVMIVIAALNAFTAITQVAGGVPAGSFLQPLAQSLHTTQGLITLVGAADPLVTAIAITIVTANIAAEWSQGTLRNLLVREPGRLRLLAGKMLALLLFVAIFTTLALLIATGITLATAQSHGISTTPWTGAEGINNYLSYFGNRLLSIVGYGLLAMFIAVLTRSTAAAVGISLAYVLVGETLLNLVWQDGARWLPVHLFGYLTGTPPMGYGSALVVALLWMVGFAVGGAATFRIQDISA